MRYFIGDPHFNHQNIIKFSRTNFNTVEEHNQFLIKKFQEWAKKLNKDTSKNSFWVLGDWFDISYLWVMENFNCDCYFMYGNHDHQKDLGLFEKYFTKVYQYPIYLTDKWCVSHVPQAVFDDQVNSYAHLHGNIIDKPNYISTCLELNNYEPVTEKKINSLFARLPKYNRKHLYAPYTEWEKVLVRPENDLILKPNGHIDLSAMRALKYIENRGVNKIC